MKKLAVLICCIILTLVSTGLIAAADPLGFTVHTDGASGIRFFDQNKRLIPSGEQVLFVYEGWTIQTSEDSLELSLPQGAMRIGSDSLISIDSLSENSVSVFVLRGQVRAVSTTDAVPIELTTKESVYELSEGDYLLFKGAEERFYSSTGTASVSTSTGRSVAIAPLESSLLSAGELGVEQTETDELDPLKEALPIKHLVRPEVVVATESVEQPPVTEPEAPSDAEAPEVKPEPEVIIAEVEPEEEPQLIIEVEPEPQEVIEVAKEPLVEEQEMEVPTEAQQTEELPERIELAIEEDPVDTTSQEIELSEIDEGRKGATYSLSAQAGVMHPLDSSGSDVPYNSLALYPSVKGSWYDLGLRVFFAYRDDPFDMSNWYTPRGDLLWDFGGGAAFSFALIDDIATDVLSLVDHLYIGGKEDAFRLLIDSKTPLDFGTGMLLKDQLVSIDDPYLHRTGFSHTLDTPYYSHEILIDDISYARLYGLRLGFRPLARSYPFTIALSSIADIDLMPTRIVTTPTVDFTFPIISETEQSALELSLGASALMLFSFDPSDPFTAFDASWDAGGPQNFLASARLDGRAGSVSYGLEGNYWEGYIQPNLFGEDWQWRRGEYLELFDDYLTDANEQYASFGAHIGYQTESFGTELSYRIPTTTGLAGLDPSSDRLALSLSFSSGPFSLQAGIASSGMISSLADSSYSLFDTDTMLYGSFEYDSKLLALKASYSNVAVYDGSYVKTTGVTIPVLSLGATLHLFDSAREGSISSALPQAEPQEKSDGTGFYLDTSISTMEAIGSTVYSGPYTGGYLLPGYRFADGHIQLRFGIQTIENPFDTNSWYYEAGNSPWAISEVFGSTDFYALRMTVIDLLSFIDEVSLGSKNSPLWISVDPYESLTLGRGMLIDGLDTSIDLPFIYRTGFQTVLDTSLLDMQLLVNDLSNPQLLAARLGLEPLKSYPFEIGLSSILDLRFVTSAEAGGSATRMLFVPGVDLTLPVSRADTHDLSVFGEVDLLTVIDENGFNLDSFSSAGSLYNYLATGGLSFTSGSFDSQASLSYSHGYLRRGLFGTDYSWRRSEIGELFDDYLTDKDESLWQFSVSLGFHEGAFAIDAFFNLDFASDFSIPWSLASASQSPDQLGISISYELNELSLRAGFTQRGLSYMIRPGNSFDLFDPSTQIYLESELTVGDLKLKTRVGSAAEYDPDYADVSSVYLSGNDDRLTGSQIIPVYQIGATFGLF